MSRKLSLLLFLVSALLISNSNGTRCYRCSEGGLIKDVRNCGKSVECRYGCKITQVLSTNEVVVEQDCFEMTFPYNSNNNNNNPSYIPSSQYPSGQLPPVVFNPHNPSNREYGSGWDNTNYNNNNNNNNVGLHGCSTLSAIQRFRSLFPYVNGYSATCNNCDWDYCNAFNGTNGLKFGAPVMIMAFIVFLKNFW